MLEWLLTFICAIFWVGLKPGTARNIVLIMFFVFLCMGLYTCVKVADVLSDLPQY